MASLAPIKPTHKAISTYYEALRGYEGQNVHHETAVRSAFQNLLAETAKPRKWTLIPELAMKVKGRSIRPDGTLRDDDWLFPRGYWEAKDTDDALNVEIRKKLNQGYPTLNTIFEDTREGVLFQNGREVHRVKLDQARELADLLNLFYNHTERDFEGFEQAVAEFKDRIPQLAGGLLEKIREAHASNPRFGASFDSLLDVCRASLNPNISRAAVDEMLVQHLLTERLFERVFQNREFVRRNVIAAEIEKVVDALVSRSFNRHDFLKSLDPFYKAIEATAKTIEDFSEKQHFLNTVYERFFQGFSVKVADTHGIVYTPQAIADFMGASVVEVLKTEFGLTLGSPGVQVLDPCTGTGNFVVNLMRRVNKRDLPRFYREQLFANEVMLLPYYVAAQNIEHEYFDITGDYESFEGLCFVDTLELAEGNQRQLSFMTEENTARVNRQKKAPINVIIANPPYNVGQVNENDNNKNRKYPVIERRVSETFAADSSASNKNALSDVYVKFYRWAIDRLEGQDGIVCFVSNNGFLQGIAFDGFRKHLAQEFDLIYHLDTKGNARTAGIRRQLEGGSVFNDMIRVGIGITLLVRHRSARSVRGCEIRYHVIGDRMKSRNKLDYLKKFATVADVPWTVLTPDARNTWLVPENAAEFAKFIPIGSKAGKMCQHEETIFTAFSVGVKTNRNDVVYGHDPRALTDRVKQFAEDYNAEVDRYARSSAKTPVDDFVRYDKIKWSESLKHNLQRGNYVELDESKIRTALYRPFCKRYLYFDRTLIERVYVFPQIFPTPETERENRCICAPGIGNRKSWGVFISDSLTDLELSFEKTQCFPFYIYDEDGTNRRENITDWALEQFQTHYKDKKITKWDIFHYVYGVLHLPSYRKRFADDLKRELPRIPFMDDFRAFVEAGEQLAELHVNYEQVEPWPLESICAEGVPLSFRVEKMKRGKDGASIVVNEILTLAGIPPEAWNYRLGNRSALDWLIDQYQVSTDKRSGLVTDPNRPDDPEAIVRLVERVVRVSVETVAIVNGLDRLEGPETSETMKRP